MGTNMDLSSIRSLLETVVSRLDGIEAKVGIASGSSPVAAPSASTSAEADEGDVARSLVAYDEHVAKVVVPLADACDALEGLKDFGDQIKAAWAGIRGLVELGSKCQKPQGGDMASQLTPHLKPTQDAIASIRKARLDRKFDWHQRALEEMLGCLSWVVVSPPPAPSSFVKDTVGSSEFWSNKIRKEYRGKDDKQIAFCDALKAVILDLSAYLKEYHLSGLAWNPRGIPFSEASSLPSSQPPPAAPTPTPAAAPPQISAAGGVANLMEELAKKRTEDGASAATGLRKVTRDQQTWRKEFKQEEMSEDLAKKSAEAEKKAEAAKQSAAGAAKGAAKKPLGPPVLEYQDRGHKWIVENHTKETAAATGGVVKVEVTDSNQQVYIYRCHHVTIEVTGKVKSVALDSCNRASVLFDTAISAFEVVNCTTVQVQTRGLCPSFSIDKTDGCIIYLTKEAAESAQFVTSKSSEMNLSFPDKDGTFLEKPIPEQFQHKIVNGAITSEVSDLYH